MVSAGRSELRRILRQKTQDSEAPRARTTWTKGMARVSSMDRMSTWVRGAAMGTARVSVGRMRPSKGLGSMTRTQPSLKEKNCSSRMAIQKPGRETMNDGRARKKPPTAGTVVARNAKASATTMARAMELAASASVCGSAVATMELTAVPVCVEMPKLPVTKPASEVRYCVSRGLSMPISSRMPSISAWERPRAGSPKRAMTPSEGRAESRRKATVKVMNRTRTACPMRRAMWAITGPPWRRGRCRPRRTRDARRPRG